MPRRNARPRPSTSTSHQDPIEKFLEKLRLQTKKTETNDETTKLPAFQEWFKKLSPLEYAALKTEQAMSEMWPVFDDLPKNYNGFSLRTVFRDMPKELRAQMMKRTTIRRSLVLAAYKKCGTDQNQNKTMNMIKDITGIRNNGPVPMKEIEYCLRRWAAEEPIDFYTDIDVLLNDEETLKTGKYVFSLEDFPLQDKTAVDCVDVLVSSWTLDGSCSLRIKIDGSSHSTLYGRSFPNKSDIESALLVVWDFWVMCQEREVPITKMKLTIDGYYNSNGSLKYFMKLTRFSTFNFETFELQKEGAKISDSLKACENINCKNLNITSGTFKGDNAETFFEAMRSCREGVQKWSIASLGIIPDEIINKGIDAVDPSFEVTMGYVKQTRQSCIVFEKTNRKSDGSLKPCKWNSYISL